MTVERGAVVNALYKLVDWLFVRTADDAVGFIPRACVEAIGPRTARDFGQQFPERTADSIGTRRGRASFSPANTTTTTASSEGDGASGDDSGASLRDAFGFLHLRNGTPSPPPPPPPPSTRWRDDLTSHHQRPVARSEMVKHPTSGQTRRIYTTEDDSDLISRHSADTYVSPLSVAVRKSRQPNGFPERQSRRSPLSVSERQNDHVVSNDDTRNATSQHTTLYQKASHNGSRRRRRYRAMANSVAVRWVQYTITFPLKPMLIVNQAQRCAIRY